MSLPSPQYIQMPQLQAYFVNKDTGAPLSGGYLLFFEDEARTVPKNVFVQQQAPGPIYIYTNIGSQVTLSSVGTTQYLGTDSLIFLYPFDANGNPELYFVEVWSSDNILQFTREGVPSGFSLTPTVTGFSESQNIVSNPQFARVLFDNVNGATFNVTGVTTTQIAPDWNVVTTGTGAFIVNQIGITDDTAPGEPAYALDIVSSGVDTIMLSQTITDSPRILEGDYASATVAAECRSPTATATLTVNYVPSMGSPTQLVTGSCASGSYTAIVPALSVLIPKTNTQSPSPSGSGNVQIQIVIPTGAHIRITCVQVISVASADVVLNYIQESTPRQIDHLFHYYQNPLNFKPIPSLLVGWDFPLNPAQFGSTQTMTTTPAYIWDQTICASATANVNVVRASSNVGAFYATTTGDTEAFYMLQYLSGAQAAETALSNLAVNITAYCLTHPGVIARVYLFNGNNSSTIPAISGGTIGALKTSPAVNGEFVLSAMNWTPVLQPNGQSSTGNVLTGFPTDLGFNGWNGGAFQGSTSNFAIVVTFFIPTSGTAVVVNSISCVPGDIPTRPAPQTADEVLRECQYYYEQSFLGATPTTNSVNSQFVSMNAVATGSHAIVYASPFTITYNTPKRANVAPVLYSSFTGTINSVDCESYFYVSNTATFTNKNNDQLVASFWSQINGNKTAIFTPILQTPLVTDTGSGTISTFVSGGIDFQYISDARLGVV